MENWTPKDLEEKLDAGDLVFLKIWKNGCGACKLSKPALENIEAKDERGMAFGQINSDDHPEILEISNSEILPFFFIFRDGKLLGKTPGFKGLKALEDFIATSCDG